MPPDEIRPTARRKACRSDVGPWSTVTASLNSIPGATAFATTAASPSASLFTHPRERDSIRLGKYQTRNAETTTFCTAMMATSLVLSERRGSRATHP